MISLKDVKKGDKFVLNNGMLAIFERFENGNYLFYTDKSTTLSKYYSNGKYNSNLFGKEYDIKKKVGSIFDTIPSNYKLLSTEVDLEQCRIGDIVMTKYGEYGNFDGRNLFSIEASNDMSNYFYPYSKENFDKYPFKCFIAGRLFSYSKYGEFNAISTAHKISQTQLFPRFDYYVYDIAYIFRKDFIILEDAILHNNDYVN